MSYFRFTVRLVPPAKSICSTIDNNLLKSSRRGFAIAAITAFTTPSANLQCQQGHYKEVKQFSSLHQTHNGPMLNASMTTTITRRSIVTHEITKNLTLFSEKPRNVDRDPQTLRLKQPIEAPLVLMPAWMLATKKHLAKYAKIYIELGFDVLTVEITPWQLLWPIKGSQLVAADTLKFLENNPSYDPIVVHGFSVGGYVFGEVLVHMARDVDRYKPVIDRIHAQIWDSAADITEIPVGVPKAIFPKNMTLQKALHSFIRYHLKTFHEQATTHYIRSSQMFHYSIIKAPTLFFLSKNDPIGAEKSNLSTKEDLESSGVNVTWKCWDRSAHVQHYKYHREEYMDYLLKHLEAHVMEKVSQKSRAKL